MSLKNSPLFRRQQALVYNAEHHPNPHAWLALDEYARLEQIEAYHRKIKDKSPSLRGHAVVHCIVETQIAERFQPACNALLRLQEQGLSRHDSIHAMGWVVSKTLHAAMNDDGTQTPAQLNEELAALLNGLNAEDWLNM